jgi:hypothetical protein
LFYFVVAQAPPLLTDASKPKEQDDLAAWRKELDDTKAKIKKIEKDAGKIENTQAKNDAYLDHPGWLALQSQIAALRQKENNLLADIKNATDPKAQGNFNEMHVMVKNVKWWVRE